MRKTNTIDIIHKALREVVHNGDLCIDATAGNGYDTLLLANLVGEAGRVLAFDIQRQALENTKKRLSEAGCVERVDLIEQSHTDLAEYAAAGSVRAVVFNLGYLPGGDHSVQTVPENTVVALQAALEVLMPGGMLAVCVYCGGDSGFAEKEVVCDFAAQLDYRRFTVWRLELANRPNNPPLALLITKEQ